MAYIAGVSKSLTSFDPRSIPGCALWLDAADTSTLFQDTSGLSAVVSNNQAVALWLDKSSNSNHCRQGSVANRPTALSNARNGQWVLNFNRTASQNFNLCSTLMNRVSNSSYFMVVRPTGTSSVSILSYGNVGATEFRHDMYVLNGNNFRTSTLFGPGLYDFTQVRNAYALCSYVYTLSGTGTNISNIGNGQTNGAQFNNINNVSGTSTINSNQYANVGYSGSGGLNYYSGQMAEIITYNRPVTPAERSMIEGYLAWKWATNGSLTAIQPFSTNRPFFRGVQPTDVSGCILWLDGADTSTMFQDTSATTPVTTDGDPVGLWRDKSGIYNHATQPTDSQRGIVRFEGHNNRPVLQFARSATQQMNICATLLPNGSNPYNYYFVVRPTSANLGVFFSYGRTVNGQGLQVYCDTTSGRYVADLRGVNQIRDNNSNINLYSMNYVRATPTLLAGLRNGTVYNGSPAQAAINLSTGFDIGILGAYNGNIAEILGYNRDLCASDRIMIEGYLASKWNLNASLATTHPFRNYDAYTNTFQPRDISGCQLWYDGADPSRMTITSGSNITIWRDKSGFGRDASANATSPATYRPVTNLFNGKMAPYFSNFSRYNINSFQPSPTGNFTCFVLGRSDTLNTSDSYIISAQTTSRFAFFLRNVSGHPITLMTSGIPVESTFYTSNSVPFNACVTVTDAPPDSIRNIYVNGALYATDTISGNTLNISSSMFLGASSATSTQMRGNICELIMYNTALSTVDRQHVEGYLAQKWGMVGDLSEGHPYRKIRF